MKLIIDSGNTLTKIAVFNKDLITFKTEEKDTSFNAIEKILQSYSVEAAIISDVSNTTNKIAERLTSVLPVVKMTGITPTPLKMEYQSCERLGTDRLAAAVFASAHYPHSPVLTIQAGTCITYDFVTKDGIYKGGGISPGLDMRFKAMNTFTANLPLVKKKEISFLLGENTQDSILSGVMNGTSAEIDGIIDQYIEKYPGLKVVIGGGDTFFFDKKLKNRIFAIENLVLKGLNLILEYNVNFKN